MPFLSCQVSICIIWFWFQLKIMASKNSTSNTQRGQNFGGCIILRWICLIWIKMFKETTCNQKQLRRPVSSNFFMKLNLRFTLKKSFISEKNPKKSQWDLQKNPIWDWDFQNRKSHMGNPIVGYPMSRQNTISGIIWYLINELWKGQTSSFIVNEKCTAIVR